jgi:predicted acetyltransferase
MGEGLTLRWGRPEDAEALAAFNVAVHSDNPAEPETWLGDWTKELMNGRHPTTDASDFTIVENEAGEIASSMNVIHQTWSYDGIPFGVGRPELVGTDERYRRRGLIRAQFKAIHALSEARGELVQAITGIPWYYRQFGYEMTLELGGGRPFRWDKRGNSESVETEAYEARPATSEDIPVLQTLYGSSQATGLVRCERNADQWQYELIDRHRSTPYALAVEVITEAEQVIGYVEYKQWGTALHVRELAVLPGHSLRAVALFVTRMLQAKAADLNKERERPITYIVFSFGMESPVYEALGPQIEEGGRPYAWFMRVADMPAFLQRIAPVLETRLADSVMAGHNGRLRLNFYRSQVQLLFSEGRITEISPYQPATFDGNDDGDAFFPDHTFLHLLFGQRTFDEIRHLRADCFVNKPEAAVLLGILFPQQPSWLRPLG